VFKSLDANDLIEGIVRERDIRRLAVAAATQFCLVFRRLARINPAPFATAAPDQVARQHPASCDVSVLTSLEEGLSRFLLESLASGTPVITTDCGGPAEFIEDDVNGFVVPIRNSQAVADKIRLLYEDRDTLSRLSENARKTIETNMSHARTVEQMLKYFEEMKAN
jgi:glycosyltransferase involved in cell wall biosynthesis